MTIYEIIAVDKQEILNLSSKIVNEYYSFPIKKSSGKLRWIDAPSDKLKEVQKQILEKFIYKFRPHPAATGFIKSKSVSYGARQHLNSQVLICFDLKDFFPSIKKSEVISLMSKLFRSYKKRYIDFTFEKDDITAIASILLFKDTHLPQGAPTSPALANLYCLEIDSKLQKLAKQYGLSYTRYADDLAFSANYKLFKGDIQEFIKSIKSTIESSSCLKLNPKKTRVLYPHHRMMVTGVVVNKKLGVPKPVWRNLRAQLHNLQTSKTGVSLSEWQLIRGKIEWIRSLSKVRGNQLLQALGKIPITN